MESVDVWYYPWWSALTVPLWKNTIFLQKNYFFDHFPLWFSIFPKYAPEKYFWICMIEAISCNKKINKKCEQIFLG